MGILSKITPLIISASILFKYATCFTSHPHLAPLPLLRTTTAKQQQPLYSHPQNSELSSIDDDTTSTIRKTPSNLLTPRDARINYPLRLSPLLCSCCTTPFFTTTPPANAAAPASTRLISDFFPTAVPISVLPLAIAGALPSYNRDNTLIATSICADEVNNPLVDVLSRDFNRPFNLGGLAGVPFVGTSGLKACMSHIPSDGKLLIVLGPHVGFDEKGYVGFVNRVGQPTSSTACGAVIGALKAIQKGVTDLGENGLVKDAQEDWILRGLSQRLPKNVLDHTDADQVITYVTYQMYVMARDYMKDLLELAGNARPLEVAILSGIVINRDGSESNDMFQPLSFTTMNKSGETKSVYRNVFGEKPHLYPVLFKNRAACAEVLDDIDVPAVPPPPPKHFRDYFPTAISHKALVDTVRLHLPTFTKQNTLVATSICSDEINFPIVDAFKKEFKDPFVLGGLAGVPFAGRSGMGACISHVPADGNLLIVLGSHVGYDDEDVVGKVNRPGQEKSSGACGAAIGALKVIQAKDGSGGSTVVTDDGSQFLTTDAQEEYILNELESRLPSALLKKPDMAAKVAFTTYATYAVARDYLEDLLGKQKSLPKEVAIVAGVIINRGTGGDDMFQPLLFQTMRGSGKPVSLYDDAFGGKPFLSMLPVMGGKREFVQDVLGDLSLGVEEA